MSRRVQSAAAECLLEIQDKIKEVVTVNERTWKERIETETRDYAKQVTGAVDLPGGRSPERGVWTDITDGALFQ
ncbi:MAG: hypothetical protein ACLTSZ_09570 [Lachnospiraceae bacterium]